MTFQRSVTTVVATAALLTLLSSDTFVRALSRPSLTAPIQPIVASLQQNELNQRDFAQLERGYYENLLSVDRFNTELWEVYQNQPVEWGVLADNFEAVERQPGLPYYKLRPNVEASHKGTVLRTNRWGMRDRDYAVEKPEGSVRLAFLGGSFVMGSGVENEEMFASLVEERLNSDRAAGSQPVEILNFGVGGYTLADVLVVLQDRALTFQPDAALYFSYRDETGQALRRMARVLAEGHEMPLPYLREIAQNAGVTPGLAREEAVRRLEPFAEEILRGSYQQFVELCRNRGVRPVWVHLPRPEEHERSAGPPAERAVAAELGFDVIDLSGVYGEGDLSELWVAPHDHHPNAEGSQLIADRLFRELSSRPLLLPSRPVTADAEETS